MVVVPLVPVCICDYRAPSERTHHSRISGRSLRPTVLHSRFAASLLLSSTQFSCHQVCTSTQCILLKQHLTRPTTLLRCTVTRLEQGSDAPLARERQPLPSRSCPVLSVLRHQRGVAGLVIDLHSRQTGPAPKDLLALETSFVAKPLSQPAQSPRPISWQSFVFPLRPLYRCSRGHNSLQRPDLYIC